MAPNRCQMAPNHTISTWVGEFDPSKRLLRDAFPTQITILALDRARHAHQGNAHRTMCKSPWTPKRRLVLSNTLRACGPRKKWNSDPQAGTPELQVRWFCARSFKTAVGSRLKDPEASEGLA